MRIGMTIDGRDAYSTWGVRLLDGSLGSVVCWPQLKADSVPINDWPEYDGIEADLSSPRLDTRTITINLSTDGNYAHYRSFINALQRPGYRVVRFEAIERSFRLRLVQWGDYNYGKELGFVSVTMADDFPLDGYTYEPPQSQGGGFPYVFPFILGSGVVADGTYTIDGRPFDRYGVKLLLGTESNLWKQGAAKARLVTNQAHLHGAECDTAIPVRSMAPSVRLIGLLQADTPVQMWQRWYALLYDLTRPGEHVFGGGKFAVDSLQARRFFYRSCNVQEFEVSDVLGIWNKFEITLQMLDALPNIHEGDVFPLTFPFILG